MKSENHNDAALIMFLLKRLIKRNLLYYYHEMAGIGFMFAYCCGLSITGVRAANAVDAAVIFLPMMVVLTVLLVILRDKYEEVNIGI